jgi:hypothetical protein
MIRLWGWFSEEFLSSSDINLQWCREPCRCGTSNRMLRSVSPSGLHSRQMHCVQTI